MVPAMPPMLFADTARRLAHMAAMALGWRPDEFWAATPADLVTALGLDVPATERPADTAMLQGLMERYPDEP
jgi:uncharacterized phage protein (TIGR02216 family)